MKQDKTLALLGLATRARKIVLGEQLVLQAMSKYPSSVIFLATDAGANITKKVTDKATTYNCMIIQRYTKEELSHAMGKERRTLALSIDGGFNHTFKEYNHF